jgi:hypothetical protein
VLVPPFAFSLTFYPPFLFTPFPHHIYLLHLVKSKHFFKEINRTLEKMKGICFTFDACGQWSEHERNKIW